jgi:uncharacterized membrane-anchored protein YhcB (DUF1043 family)
MAFVFSVWYFVMIALVAGIVASLVVFFKMDQKDRVMIDEFVKNAQVQTEPAKEKNEVKDDQQN